MSNLKQTACVCVYVVLDMLSDFVLQPIFSCLQKGFEDGEGAKCVAVSVDVGGEVNFSESLTSITLRDAGDGG